MVDTSRDSYESTPDNVYSYGVNARYLSSHPPKQTIIDMDTEYINSDLMDNKDLTDNNYQNMFDSPMSRLPLMESLSMNGMEDLFATVRHPTLEVQSSMVQPYFLLEFAACTFVTFLMHANILTFALLATRSNSNDDALIKYIIYKVVNLSTLAAANYIFTSPDTYKSINMTISYLMINAIIYEYTFVTILRYIAIHITAALMSSFLALGIYHDLIQNVPTKTLLSNVFSTTRSYSFSYSYILVAIIMHLLMSVALTVITNMTTSVNARSMTLHKAFTMFLISVTFGSVIGPIGYVLPNLVLYSAVIIARGEYTSFNFSLFTTYVLTVIAIFTAYPIIAVQIKFVWRNRYRRYIEYDLR